MERHLPFFSVKGQQRKRLKCRLNSVSHGSPSDNTEDGGLYGSVRQKRAEPTEDMQG